MIITSYSSFVCLFVALVVYFVQKVVFQFALEFKGTDQMIVFVLRVSVNGVFVLFFRFLHSPFNFCPNPAFPLLANLDSFSFSSSFSQIFQMTFKIKLFLLFQFILLTAFSLFSLTSLSEEDALIYGLFSVALIFGDGYFIKTSIKGRILVSHHETIIVLSFVLLLVLLLFLEIADFLLDIFLAIEDLLQHLHKVRHTP